jgi:hypothetical protein
VQHQVFIPKTKFKNLAGKGMSKKNETMKADLTPISENEKSRYKRLNSVSLGHVENQKMAQEMKTAVRSMCSKNP